MAIDITVNALFESYPDYIAPLFDGVTYAWEVLPRIGDYIRKLLAEKPAGFTEIAPGILAGEGVRIAPTATLEPPCVLGPGTVLRPGAFLRGNVLTGPDCVIGNSSEVKNAVLLRHVEAPHFNYIGDAVLGNFAHTGAGVICSNLKSDKKNVVIRNGDEAYETGLRKCSAILGDHADIGCNCVLNPGTVVGRGTSAYPTTMLRGVYPGGCIVKATRVIVPRA